MIFLTLVNTLLERTSKFHFSFHAVFFLYPSWIHSIPLINIFSNNISFIFLFANSLEQYPSQWIHYFYPMNAMVLIILLIYLTLIDLALGTGLELRNTKCLPPINLKVFVLQIRLKDFFFF